MMDDDEGEPLIEVMILYFQKIVKVSTTVEKMG